MTVKQFNTIMAKLDSIEKALPKKVASGFPTSPHVADPIKPEKYDDLVRPDRMSPPEYAESWNPETQAPFTPESWAVWYKKVIDAGGC